VVEQDTPALLAVLETEAPEVGAVVLSKLKVSRAAELLGQLPGPHARRITYAVSLIADIAPATVARIGEALASELGREKPRAFSGGPVERVGAILNFSRAATRNDVLTGLDETDPTFATAVRKSIFTYLNIPARVGPRDVPKLLKKVDQKVLVTALAASTTDETRPTAEFILANISQRMAESLKGEAEEMGEVAAADGESAMTGVVAAIRELEEAGEIYLVAEEE
jgi:flagellar motor switch protein FliG